MAFFDSLRRVLGGGAAGGQTDAVKLAEAWGMSDTSHPEFPGAAPAADPEAMAAPNKPSAYDVEQIRKKIKRILEKLPQSQPEWDVMLAEAKALGLEDEWLLKAQIDEFAMLVRRAVADRHITEQEHRKLDIARQLIGMSEEDAVTLLHSVTAEAEAFFGKPIEGA